MMMIWEIMMIVALNMEIVVLGLNFVIIKQYVNLITAALVNNAARMMVVVVTDQNIATMKQKVHNQ